MNRKVPVLRCVFAVSLRDLCGVFVTPAEPSGVGIAGENKFRSL